MKKNNRRTDKKINKDVNAMENKAAATGYSEDYYRGRTEGFANGQEHAKAVAEREASVRADEKAVIFNGAQETIPIRSVSNQLLISKFKDNTTHMAELSTELSVRSKLQTSLENEMNFRGLIALRG